MKLKLLSLAAGLMIGVGIMALLVYWEVYP